MHKHKLFHKKAVFLEINIGYVVEVSKNCTLNTNFLQTASLVFSFNFGTNISEINPTITIMAV